MLFSIGAPSGVLKKIKRAAPKAIGGITIGRSSNESMISFPGNLERDIAYAAGTAIIMQIIVDKLAVIMLNLMAKSTSSENNAVMNVLMSVYHANEAITQKKNKMRNISAPFVTKLNPSREYFKMQVPQHLVRISLLQSKSQNTHTY